MKQVVIKCHHCENEFFVTPYFSSPYLAVGTSAYDGTRYYTASVDATAVCPFCGVTITQSFKDGVSAEDIINIATRNE
jgi:ribosomal protein S27E